MTRMSMKRWVWYFNSKTGHAYKIAASAWLDSNGQPHERHTVRDTGNDETIGTYDSPADAYRAMGHTSSH